MQHFNKTWPIVIGAPLDTINPSNDVSKSAYIQFLKKEEPKPKVKDPSKSDDKNIEGDVYVNIHTTNNISDLYKETNINASIEAKNKIFNINSGFSLVDTEEDRHNYLFVAIYGHKVQSTQDIDGSFVLTEKGKLLMNEVDDCKNALLFLKKVGTECVTKIRKGGKFILIYKYVFDKSIDTKSMELKIKNDSTSFNSFASYSKYFKEKKIDVKFEVVIDIQGFTDSDKDKISKLIESILVNPDGNYNVLMAQISEFLKHFATSQAGGEIISYNSSKMGSIEGINLEKFEFFNLADQSIDGANTQALILSIMKKTLLRYIEIAQLLAAGPEKYLSDTKYLSIIYEWRDKLNIINKNIMKNYFSMFNSCNAWESIRLPRIPILKNNLSSIVRKDILSRPYWKSKWNSLYMGSGGMFQYDLFLFPVIVLPYEEIVSSLIIKKDDDGTKTNVYFIDKLLIHNVNNVEEGFFNLWKLENSVVAHPESHSAEDRKIKADELMYNFLKSKENEKYCVSYILVDNSEVEFEFQPLKFD